MQFERPGSTDDAFSAPPTGSLIQDVARRFARDLPPAPAGDFIREAEGLAAAIARPAVALDTLDLVGITHGISTLRRGAGPNHFRAQDGAETAS